MTESEWLSAISPDPLRQWIGTNGPQRKLRLFACACARRCLSKIRCEKCRTSLEVAERFADGQATKKELDLANQAADWAANVSSYRAADWAANVSSYWASYWAANVASYRAANVASYRAANEASYWAADWGAERKVQASLFRDIFGNPFRPVSIDSRWLTSNVVDLSSTIYDNRDYDRMPILADALMEAGCDNDEIIQHCLSDKPHVRGCWVVDLILKKE